MSVNIYYDFLVVISSAQVHGVPGRGDSREMKTGDLVVKRLFNF